MYDGARGRCRSNSARYALSFADLHDKIWIILRSFEMSLKYPIAGIKFFDEKDSSESECVTITKMMQSNGDIFLFGTNKAWELPEKTIDYKIG